MLGKRSIPLTIPPTDDVVYKAQKLIHNNISKENIYSIINNENNDSSSIEKNHHHKNKNNTINDDDFVVRRQYRKDDHTMSEWEVLLRRSSHTNNKQSWTYHFENNGGILRVHLNILSDSMKKDITNEIINNKKLFRQYRVQNTVEPRVHYLLHEEATKDFNR